MKRYISSVSVYVDHNGTDELAAVISNAIERPDDEVIDSARDLVQLWADKGLNATFKVNYTTRFGE